MDEKLNGLKERIIQFREICEKCCKNNQAYQERDGEFIFMGKLQAIDSILKMLDEYEDNELLHR